MSGCRSNAGAWITVNKLLRLKPEELHAQLKGGLDDIERLSLRVRATIVRNASTTTVARLDACDWRREPTAAEGTTGAIDLSEEHDDIVRISAGTGKRFD
jgi:hypothetical protein